MRPNLRVTADPSLRKKYRKLQRWNLRFRQIYGPPGTAVWGVDQWSDRLGGYFTRHGNRNFAINQVSRLLRVVYRQQQQEKRSVWLLPIDHQSHQRPSFLYGNLRQRFPRRSAEAERRWIARLRRRLLAARDGAEDQESQLGTTRLRVDETQSFWQQRGLRRKVPLDLAHHLLVGARWEYPDRLLLNPHFMRLMRPAVAFIRGSEGSPPPFRAGVLERLRRLGGHYRQLAAIRPANLWQLRTRYWRHWQRHMLLRSLCRLRRAFRCALEQLRSLVTRAAASSSRGTLEPLKRSLGLLLQVAPASIRHRYTLETRLVRDPRFRLLWRALRRYCGPSLPASGDRWLRRQLRRETTSIPATLERPQPPYRQRPPRCRTILRSPATGERRGVLAALAVKLFHRRYYTMRHTRPGRWLRRRLKRYRRQRPATAAGGGAVAIRQRWVLRRWQRRLRRTFGHRFSPCYSQPRRQVSVIRRRRRWAIRRRRQRRSTHRRRRLRQEQAILRKRRRRWQTGEPLQRPVFEVPREYRVTTQRWKTLQRPMPRTLSFRYTTPGPHRTTARWRYPAQLALTRCHGRLHRLVVKRSGSHRLRTMPWGGTQLRTLLTHSGRERERTSDRRPLTHYRVLELTVGDPNELDDDGLELLPERWLVLERSYEAVGYDNLMADLFGVLTPALRLMSKVVGHKSARRTIYHARDGVPLSQRRKLIFGWLRDLVNKNPDYNYLRRNTLRKRPSKRVLVRPERSRRLTEPFRPRLYNELHSLLQPEAPMIERLEDFDEKSHQLRLTRRHYRWNLWWPLLHP